MNKVFPYLYFVIAGVWMIDGIREFLQPKEFYHIFLSYKTESKYWFLAFKLMIGILVVLAGIRRLRMIEK